jgi:hypothetical protein
MHRLHLVRSVPPRPDKRSAKVIELRIRREAGKDRLKPQLPDRPDAA